MMTMYDSNTEVAGYRHVEFLPALCFLSSSGVLFRCIITVF